MFGLFALSLYNPLMFVRTKKTSNSPRKSVQIVESIRTGSKVSQVIVRHVGIADDDEQLLALHRLGREIINGIEAERRAENEKNMGVQIELFPEESLALDSLAYDADGERVLDEEDDTKLASLEHDDRVLDGPFEVVEWAFHNMGLHEIFGKTARDAAKVKILKQCLAGMLSCPSSKLGLSSWLARFYADGVYRFMDVFATKRKRVMDIVRRNSESLLSEKPTLMLFDVTTLYFESVEEDELRKRGYSKDNRAKETQIVLALGTTPGGMPLWYRTYPGNTWEGHTFRDFIGNWKESNDGASAGVVVADCGMFSKCNLQDLRENDLYYVLGCPLKKLPEREQALIQERSGYRELSNGEEPLLYRVLERWDGSRVLVTWSDSRARKNAHDRQKQIDRLCKKLDKSPDGSIGADSVMGNRGTKKYLKLADGEAPNNYVLDGERISAESRWDGLRGVITDLPLSTPEEIREVLNHYHSLWRIEESFRIGKSDMKIRPMYHWTKGRIEAHILLCYLVFACVRYIERRVLMQGKERLSLRKLREAILSVDSAILRDSETGKIYRLPRKLTPLAQKLYRCLGLRRDTKPRELLKVSAYYRRRVLLEKGLEEANDTLS